MATGPFPNVPKATPAVYPDTDIPIQLSVDGTKIVHNSTLPVQLKGFCRPSLEWSKTGSYLNPADVVKWTSWGGNIVRISMNQQFWFESQGDEVEGSYKQIIDAIVSLATQNKMAVIFDLHWTDAPTHSVNLDEKKGVSKAEIYAQYQQSKENNLEDKARWQPPMANRKSIQFWRELAQKYGKFGTVLFELFNEPYDIDPAVWLNGNDQYAGMQEMLDEIRNHSDNPVIVNGLDWGFSLDHVSQCRVQGKNIIYGSHPYNNKEDSYGGLEKNFESVINTNPIICTEFGAWGKQFYDALAKWKKIYETYVASFKKLKIHFTAWAAWAGEDEFPSLITDWDTYNPRNGGTIIKPDMQLATPFFLKPAALKSTILSQATNFASFDVLKNFIEKNEKLLGLHQNTIKKFLKKFLSCLFHIFCKETKSLQWASALLKFISHLESNHQKDFLHHIQEEMTGFSGSVKNFSFFSHFQDLTIPQAEEKDTAEQLQEKYHILYTRLWMYLVSIHDQSPEKACAMRALLVLCSLNKPIIQNGVLAENNISDQLKILQKHRNISSKIFSCCAKSPQSYSIAKEFVTIFKKLKDSKQNNSQLQNTLLS